MLLLSKLVFIKKNKESGDIYSFYFKKPSHFRHKAGQHGIFFLSNFSRPHPFSLASSPDEDVVMIGTHVGSNSRFKRGLMKLEEGDSVTMVGPIMNFTFRDNASKYVFLAQGIGITPFRSMLLYAKNNNVDIDTTLIHVDAAEHTFKDETVSLARRSFYVNDIASFQERVRNTDTDALFYVSGSPRYIQATKALLIERGINGSHIISDNFLGY